MKNNEGFNLVELLVAIGILGLLLTAVMANFRGSSPNQILDLQSESLATVLREAQASAMQGKPWGGSVPIGGYGIKIETCSTPPCMVKVFADSNANFKLDEPAELTETVSLGEKVTVQTLSTGSPMILLFNHQHQFSVLMGVVQHLSLQL